MQLTTSSLLQFFKIGKKNNIKKVDCLLWKHFLPANYDVFAILTVRVHQITITAYTTHIFYIIKKFRLSIPNNRL